MISKPLPLRPKMLETCDEPRYIASGSTCDVYRVTYRDRDCALKVMSCGTDAVLYHRAVEEATLHQRLAGRSNILPFVRYETMERSGRTYVFLLLQYMTTLEQHFSTTPMTVGEVAQLGLDLCDALLTCQNAGLAHLDVQAKNVYRDREGHWCLGDFGCALPLQEMEACKELRGTPSYIAPEVYHHRRYTRRTDMYSLGILLYCLMNDGNLPFGRSCDKATAIRRRLEGEELPPLSRAGQPLSQFILSACAPDLRKRPVYLEDFRKQLQRAISESVREVLNRPVNPWVLPQDLKQAKPSLLDKLFGKKPQAVPTVPAAAQNREYQMFTPDETSAPREEEQTAAEATVLSAPPGGPDIFGKGPWVSTTPLVPPTQAPSGFAPPPPPPTCSRAAVPEVPQIFDSDGFATTCAMSGPQVFDSDAFASTCPLDASAGQIFDSDDYATTCAMDSPQIFDSDGFATTCPLEAPVPMAAPGYAPPPPPPAPNYGAAPGYAPPAPNYGQAPYAPAPGYPPAQPYGYPPQGGYAYPPQGYGYPPQGYGYPPYGQAPGYGGYGAPPAPRMDQVRFSALAPRSVERDAYFLTQIFMYQEQFRQVVDQAIAQAEQPQQEKSSGFQQVQENTRVTIRLSSPDVVIDDDENTQVWTGGYLSFDFAVFLAPDYAKNQILLKATVYFDGVPATKLMLTVKVQAAANAPVEVKRQDILSAFVSYASQDRGRVASLIQGMSKARPDLDIFFDVNSLTSGQRWEERLYSEIDARDILFLCWSQNAKSSPWVEREWRYALQTKGVDAIEPIPLEQPDLCPPPQELSSKHFNDTLLYIINR